METVSERRRRKLIALSKARGGVAAIARAAKLSPAALDQVIKGTLLPAKADGSRSPKALGEPSARAIERALDLGHGWFDADDAAEPQVSRPAADEVARAFETLAEMLSAADDVTRSAIAGSFSLLATHPDKLENVIATVKKLLPARTLARTSQDDGPTGLVFRDLGSGELNPDEQRSTVQIQRSRRAPK